MAPTAPAHPQHTWMARHKFVRIMLVLLMVVALATVAGAIICTIY